MKRRFPLAVCTLALCLRAFSVAICAEQVGPSGYPSSDPFEILQKALRAERESRARTPGTAGAGREVYETSGYLEAVRQALSRGDDNNALSALTQLEAMASTPEVRHACEAVADKINRDRTTREQSLNAEVDAAIKRAADTVLQAKVPKDLDAQIENFNRLAEEHSTRYASDGRETRTAQKIQGALTFLSRWQDYLAAVAGGDDQQAANTMRSLAESNSNHTLLVPRSEIVARQTVAHRGENEIGSDRSRRVSVETNAVVAEALDGCHTLADIPATLTRLNDLRMKQTGNNSSIDANTDLSVAINNLQAIQRAAAELHTGLATTINASTLRAEGSVRPGVDSHLAGLRAELIALALPRLLNSPDAKAADGERANEFLRRLVDAAKERGDWDAMSRGMEIARALSTGTAASGYQQPSDAYKQFFVGLNMEASGQYEQAVIAFLTALKTGSQDLPTRVIGEHLAAIQKDHPKEYGEANTYVLNPPAPQYQPGGPYGPGYRPYPGQRMMIDPRTGRPTGMMEGAETPTPNPVLTVPAVSPAPKPAPSASLSPTPTPFASSEPTPTPAR